MKLWDQPSNMLTVSTQTDTEYDMVISGTVAGLLKVRRSTVDDLAACTGITRATLSRYTLAA